MPQLKPTSTKEIMNELAFGNYIPKRKDLLKVIDTCKKALDAQFAKTYNQQKQVAMTLKFIECLWEKYDCKEIASIYSNFVNLEEALYGLEREEEAGKRYRDHFIHMFNTFIFGLRIINFMIKKLEEKDVKKLFRIKNENLKELKLFPRDYTYKERLFYLWMLIATFHDIAIPFEHLTRMGKGVNRFIEEFGWIFKDASISMRNFDSSQLYQYFCLLSSIYGGKLDWENEGKKYKRSKQHQDYLLKILGRWFDREDHGVLSGFFMWKTIEEIFLLDRGKYKFNIDQFNKYAEYVLEQDIARAALTISLHNINEDEKTKAYPKIFPIKFRDFPLTFLLIVSDELQEYVRWEGTSLERKMRFDTQPKLQIKIDGSKKHNVEIIVILSLNDKQENYIIDQARKRGVSTGETNIDAKAAVRMMIGDRIKEKLERKLFLGEDFKLRLEIYSRWDKKKELYGENF